MELTWSEVACEKRIREVDKKIFNIYMFLIHRPDSVCPGTADEAGVYPPLRPNDVVAPRQWQQRPHGAGPHRPLGGGGNKVRRWGKSKKVNYSYFFG